MSDATGVLAGESEFMGQFSGYYPAQRFITGRPTNIESFSAYGTFFPDNMDPSFVSGWTVQIFEDDNNSPNGFAFADVSGDGAFGSDALYYFPNLKEGSGIDYGYNGIGINVVRVDFKVANGGKEFILPKGRYWISIAPRTTEWLPGADQGRWKWQPARPVNSGPNSTTQQMYKTTSGEVQMWQPVKFTFPNSPNFSYEFFGTELIIMGDTNQDERVDLLDVLPFVDMVFDGGLYNDVFEGDFAMNYDVNVFDIPGFIEALMNL
ncbi:MAG: hypothetical protein AAGA30_02520 [Planctomycetota bacterium]